MKVIFIDSPKITVDGKDIYVETESSNIDETLQQWLTRKWAYVIVNKNKQFFKNIIGFYLYDIQAVSFFGKAGFFIRYAYMRENNKTEDGRGA